MGYGVWGLEQTHIRHQRQDVIRQTSDVFEPHPLFPMPYSPLLRLLTIRLHFRKVVGLERRLELDLLSLL
jgi:hypothetical protein